MRRRRVLGAGLGLALALGAGASLGCGEDERPSTRGPDDARFEIGDAQARPAQPAACPKAARPRLDAAARAVRVADLEERRGPAPSTLVTADDLTLECVRWDGWGGQRAEGRGVARVLVCHPTCANGTEERVAAHVVLSGLRACDGRRWYGAARVRLQRKAQAAPASYLRPPC